MTAWKQFVFGKLVQSPRGAIVDGFDYACTGKSRDFPRPLEPHCHPSRVGIGTSDAFRWSEHAWPEGGLVAMPIVVEGHAHMLAARVRGCSERGEGLAGRTFVQVRYAASSAEGFAPRALLGLGALSAEPMVATDFDLPAIDLPDAPSSTPLPDDWLDQVAPVLEVVMSGQPIAVVDWTLPIEQALLRIAVCVAAVPRALGWRLGVGAGLGCMDGAPAIAFGMEARGIVRIIDGRRAGADRVDLASGERYVMWLRSRALRCRTLGSLEDEIAIRIPSFSRFDAVAAGTPWPEVALAVVRDLREDDRLEALRTWIVSPAAALPELSFATRRADALRAIITGLSGEAARLLPGVAGPDWAPVWQALAPHDPVAKAVAALLGFASIASPGDVLPATRVDLPEVTAIQAEATLLAALREDREAVAWTALARSLPGERAWIARWRERASARLLELGLRSGASASGLVEALSATGPGRALTTLSTGGAALDEAAASIAGAMASVGAGAEVATALVDRVWRGSEDPVATCLTADALAAKGMLATLRDPVGVANALLATLPALRSPPSSSMVRLMLSHGDPRTWTDGLKQRLADQIGGTLAAVLLDVKGPGVAPHGQAALPFAVEAIERDPGAVRRLLRACRLRPTQETDLRRHLLRKWADAEVSAAEPSLVWLHAALRGKPPPASRTSSSTERDELRIALEIALDHGNGARVLAAAKSREELSTCLALLPQHVLAAPPRAALPAIVELATIEGSEKDRWIAEITRRGIKTVRGWRVIVRSRAAPPHEDRHDDRDMLDGEESDAVDRLSDLAVIRLAFTGVLASRERLDALSLDGAPGLRADVSTLVRAVRMARAIGSPRLCAAVAAVGVAEALALRTPWPEIERALRPRPMLARLTDALTRRTPLATPLDVVSYAAEILGAPERDWLLDQRPRGQWGNGGR
jgi:hypothetical protein